MAAGLASELLEKFEPGIKQVTLIPSSGGAFEVTVNGKLIYSKKQSGRHAEAGEILSLIKKFIEEG
ncbi:MAG: Rdx family protein [Chloroflexi bacterium]|nr:Rdx family protein [Chloroflexota bacterium]